MKCAMTLSIRLPEWAEPEDAACTVNGTPRALSLDGRYAVVGPTDTGDVVTFTVPIKERTDVRWIQGTKYTIVRRGNDVVFIDPPGREVPALSARALPFGRDAVEEGYSLRAGKGDRMG